MVHDRPVSPGPIDGAHLATVARELQVAYDLPSLAYAVVVLGHTPVVGAMGTARSAGRVAATPDTRFHLGSAAKVWTADVVREFVCAGQLDLDGTIGAYVPHLPTTWQRTTLRQLLQHTAGIDDYVLHVPDDLGLPNAEVYRLMAEVPTLHAAGAAWSYSNTHYRLLGDAIEAVTGRSFAQVMGERFSRAGMADTRVDFGERSDPRRADPCRRGTVRWERDEAFFAINVASADGGISTTAADASRWLEAVLVADGGSTGTSHVELLGAELAGGYRFPYGVGQWLDVTSSGQRMLWHSGIVPGFNAHWLRLPSMGIGVCVLCNAIASPGTAQHIAEAMCEVVAPDTTPLGLAPLTDTSTLRVPEARALLCGGNTILGDAPIAPPISIVESTRRSRLRVDYSNVAPPDAFDCVQFDTDADGASTARYRLRWGARIAHATIARDCNDRIWRISRC